MKKWIVHEHEGGESVLLATPMMYDQNNKWCMSGSVILTIEEAESMAQELLALTQDLRRRQEPTTGEQLAFPFGGQ